MSELEPETWWTASHKDSEVWGGPYPTREEATKKALEEFDSPWICRAQRSLYGAEDLLSALSIPDLIVRWEETLGEELIGEDGESPFDSWNVHYQLSLEDFLKEAAEKWQDSVGLKRAPAWMFTDMDNPIYVGEPEPSWLP